MGVKYNAMVSYSQSMANNHPLKLEAFVQGQFVPNCLKI